MVLVNNILSNKDPKEEVWMAMMSNIETEVEPIENIFKHWDSVLGRDYFAYKNHVYRVFNFSLLLTYPNDKDKEKLAIAASFHDVGIWNDRTFDYLDPSVALAIQYLESIGKQAWSKEIGLMINFHHKLTRYKDTDYPLVDVFRKADWIDVTKGKRSFGLRKDEIRKVISAFPNRGFHRKLIKLTKSEFKKSPLKPLPMMKF